MHLLFNDKIWLIMCIEDSFSNGANKNGCSLAKVTALIHTCNYFMKTGI